MHSRYLTACACLSLVLAAFLLAGGTVASPTLATASADSILINAVHYYSYSSSGEAIQLINTATITQPLAGWTLTDQSDSGGIQFGANVVIGPQQTLWVGRDAETFTLRFGHAPAVTSADWTGSWRSLNNDGDHAALFDASGVLRDRVVYGNANTAVAGWHGNSILPYLGSNFAQRGQILYRRLDEATGRPIPDTDQAADWAQTIVTDTTTHPAIRYPGWDIDTWFMPFTVTTTAKITVAISPDNSFDVVNQQIASAQSSIQASALIFTNWRLMQQLIAAAERGVAVTLLLEGGPPGGLLDQTRYLCEQLEQAGGACWFMINETDSSIPANERAYDRYRYLHAKYMLIDHQRTLISTDNFTGSSMPYDDRFDGTSGRRGVVLIIEDEAIVARLQQLWSADFNPTHHNDIFRWSADHPRYENQYGLAPFGYAVDDSTGGFTYTIRYPNPIAISGTFAIELFTAPEAAIRQQDALLGLIGRAAAGDSIAVQQLDERLTWGNNAQRLPNPRVDALLAAARRGASVHIMLDSYHHERYASAEDPHSNVTTCTTLNQIARVESLRLNCVLANPTDLGIHSKLFLLDVAGEGIVHIGSLNGSEQSSLGNRELAIQISSNELYNYLRDVFDADWPHRLYLPMTQRDVSGVTNYPLITEVMYDTVGPDEAEYIELANPTGQAIELSGWSIGDATALGQFEDVRRFPDGTYIEPFSTLVIGREARAVAATFGITPTFELFNSDPKVPDLIDDPRWDSNASLTLANGGDEVVLRSADGLIVDIVAYGSSDYTQIHPAPLVSQPNRALVRRPWYHDSDHCINDFVEDNAQPGLLRE